MNNQVNKSYRGKPDRFYIFDAEGKVAYNAGRGPFSFRPSIEVAPFVLYKLTDTPAIGP